MILFETRSEWLGSLPKNITFAEVGVYRGEFAREIYNYCDLKKLYLIDCWQGQTGEYERDPTNGTLRARGDQIFMEVFNAFGNKPNVEIIKAFSTEACQRFEKNFFDVVYIDADHTFEAVLRDLKDWWPLVKPGGFLAGHDYVQGIPWVDVFEALNVFMDQNSLSFYSLSREQVPSWSIMKN